MINNNTLRIKLKQRLNKLDSNDYDNIEDWQIIEAFNKAQIEWVRRQLHGNNLFKEGDEHSKRRIDDLQILLTERPLTGTQTEGYFESDNFPTHNYLEYKRVSADASNDCCESPLPMTVYLAEEANVELYLRDPLKNPDFKKLAESYGIKSIYCENPTDLPETLNTFLNFQGPILLECRVLSDICLPLVKPGQKLDDMLLYNDDIQLENKNILPPS